MFARLSHNQTDESPITFNASKVSLSVKVIVPIFVVCVAWARIYFTTEAHERDIVAIKAVQAGLATKEDVARLERAQSQMLQLLLEQRKP